METVWPHQQTVTELEHRGYETELIKPHFSDIDFQRINDTADTATVLYMMEIEGQLVDGLYEDPSVPLDFVELFDMPPVVGRMMYYPFRWSGGSYTDKNLIDDLCEIAASREIRAKRDELRWELDQLL